jgi:hypothetical protein
MLTPPEDLFRVQVVVRIRFVTIMSNFDDLYRVCALRVKPAEIALMLTIGHNRNAIKVLPL